MVHIEHKIFIVRSVMYLRRLSFQQYNMFCVKESNVLCFNLILHYLPVDGSTYSILLKETLCYKKSSPWHSGSLSINAPQAPRQNPELLFAKLPLFDIGFKYLLLFNLDVNIFISGKQKTTPCEVRWKNKDRSLADGDLVHICVLIWICRGE